MPAVQSLDELIARKAAEFADQIKKAAALADKEEEIRIEAERQLAFIEKATGIKLEGKHEFTVASGRVDSVYDRVIIEYKNPKSPGARIGPKADSPGSKKVVDQIKQRFYDMRAEHRYQLNKMFGVGLTLAVVMDATLVRGLLVPAFMRLMGRANWWAPGPFRRFHDRFGVREEPDVVALPEARETVGGRR